MLVPFRSTSWEYWWVLYTAWFIKNFHLRYQIWQQISAPILLLQGAAPQVPPGLRRGYPAGAEHTGWPGRQWGVHCLRIGQWPYYHLMAVILNNVHFSSVQSLSRVRLCDPMNRSTPGLPVYHHLPEFTQTHVHRVSDAIQPSHPLSSPSPAPNPSQHQGLFQWVSSSHEVAKVLEFQL